MYLVLARRSLVWSRFFFRTHSLWHRHSGRKVSWLFLWWWWWWWWWWPFSKHAHQGFFLLPIFLYLLPFFLSFLFHTKPLSLSLSLSSHQASSMDETCQAYIRYPVHCWSFEFYIDSSTWDGCSRASSNCCHAINRRCVSLKWLLLGRYHPTIPFNLLFY